MSDTEDVLYLDSKEELAKKKSYPSLQPGNYLFRIVKVIPELAPKWANNKPVAGKFEFGYRICCSAVRTESGDPMLDTEGNEVAPLTRIVARRNINPKSIGFKKDGSPSLLRSFVSTLEGSNIQERIACPSFVVISPDGELIDDKEYKAKILAELNGKAQKELLNQGFYAVPDLRIYEGRYVGASIEVNEGGYENITKFGKVPNSFVKPSQQAIEEFNINVLPKYLEKQPAKTAQSYNSSGGSASKEEVDKVFGNEDVGEVEMPEVAIS